MSLIATIDNGNTNTTVGVFIDEQLKEVLPLESFLKREDHKDFTLICSSVGKTDELEKLSNITFIKDFYKDGQFFSMPVNYTETLGIDRLVVARKIFNEDPINTLIIDAGTFITADFVGPGGFLGGYIFPGLLTTLKSYGIGENLPEYVEGEFLKTFALPNNTEKAIKEAVSFQILSTIESLIKEYHPEEIIFTGGCAGLIGAHFENAKICENLIHEALFELRKNHV